MTTAKHDVQPGAKSRANAPSKPAATAHSGVADPQRHAKISEGAYYLWLEQGLLDPDPVRDWLIAERMIDSAFLPHR